MELVLLFFVIAGLVWMFNINRQVTSIRRDVRHQKHFIAMVENICNGGIWEKENVPLDSLRNLIREPYDDSLKDPPVYEAWRFLGANSGLGYIRAQTAHGLYEYLEIQPFGFGVNYGFHFVEETIVCWEENGVARPENKSRQPTITDLERAGARVCRTKAEKSLLEHTLGFTGR